MEQNNRKKDIKCRRELQNLECQHYIQKRTKISSGHVQQAGNKSFWMWKQYRVAYKNWEYKLQHAKNGSIWYNKLLKRAALEQNDKL